MNLLNVTFKDTGKLLLQKENGETVEIASIDSGGITFKVPAVFNGVVQIPGQVRAGQLILNGTDNNLLRLVAGNYGMIFRNDGVATYLLPTNAGDQYGSWNDKTAGLHIMNNGSYATFVSGGGGSGVFRVNAPYGSESSIQYDSNGKRDTWIVGEGCAGYPSQFVWYNSSNGGTKARLTRVGDFITAGSITPGGNLILPAMNAEETRDIVFSRPPDYEYETRMDLYRSEIRIYTYDKSGTYASRFRFRLSDSAFITSGKVYVLGGSVGTVMSKQDLRIATGTVQAGYTANKQLNIAVTFPSGLFSAVPAVYISNMSAVPTEFTRVPTVTNVTKTGCTLCLYRTSATQTEVRWTAVGS